MKTLSFSKKQLRILTLQLQQTGDGFTIPQLRSLDKVLTVMEKPIEDFNSKITDLLRTSTSENQEEVNSAMETLLSFHGSEEVNLELEDADFDFIKTQWSATKGFKGDKEVREIVIAIDDILK